MRPLPSGKPAKVVWQIAWDGENVFISGPLGDKLLAMGVLEMAKQSVIAFNPIQVAQPGDIPPEGKPN